MLQARIKNQPDFHAERQGKIASQLATEGAPVAAIGKAAVDTLEVLPRASADTRADVSRDVQQTVKAIETARAPAAEKADSLAKIVQSAGRADAPAVERSAIQAFGRIAVEPALRQRYDALVAGAQARKQ